MKRVLLQLEAGEPVSSFDSVVAIDAGVDHLLRYPRVSASTVESIVHGAMFTRGVDDLRNTAIFVGGTDVRAAENLFAACQEVFFGPIRVSMMLDANGCNTTAAAAVATAMRHIELTDATATVLGGTGPVGRRAAQMLAAAGATVRLVSRSIDRATDACETIAAITNGHLIPVVAFNSNQIADAAEGAQLIIASGAAGVEFVDRNVIEDLASLRVAIDLNAVPPAGIGGIEVHDKAAKIGRVVTYGAIGVGGLKMKTHRIAVARLFETNEAVLDAAEIFSIARSIG